MRRYSFERFYYQKIALAEGCGCAEHVTRMRDIDELAAAQAFARPRFVLFGKVAGAIAAARAALGRLAYRPGLRSSRI